VNHEKPDLLFLISHKILDAILSKGV